MPLHGGPGREEVMERERLPEYAEMWPGVAENRRREGLFRAGRRLQDVDVCLFTHVGSNFNVSFGDRAGTGVVSVDAFTGSAHAAAKSLARPLGSTP
jgi:aminobenzoyl-glutamate utilization protein B